MSKTDIMAALAKPGCAPSTIEDLATLGDYIIKTLTRNTPDAGDMVTQADLCKHFHCSRTRIALAILRAKLQGTKVGNATKYPRAIAIAALAPHLYN